MKPHNQVEQFVKKAALETDAVLHERILQEMQDAYGKATAGPARRHPDYWGLVFESRSVRLGAAALIFLALIILIGEFGIWLTGGSLAIGVLHFLQHSFVQGGVGLKSRLPHELFYVVLRFHWDTSPFSNDRSRISP